MGELPESVPLNEHYKLPADPLNYENQLRDNFARTRPEYLSLLEANLEQISQRPTGREVLFLEPYNRDGFKQWHIGSLSEGAQALLEGLLQLTGARTLRDDRACNLNRGLIIKKGIYRGQEIYLEHRYAFDWGYAKMVNGYSLLDEQAAERACKEIF